MGSHFDETTRIPTSFHNPDGLHLTFMVGWYGQFVHKEADRVYVLYRGTMTEMDLMFGNSSNGIYEAHFEDPLHCEPYGFVVVTTDDTVCCIHGIHWTVTYFLSFSLSLHSIKMCVDCLNTK